MQEIAHEGYQQMNHLEVGYFRCECLEVTVVTQISSFLLLTSIHLYLSRLRYECSDVEAYHTISRLPQTFCTTTNTLPTGSHQPSVFSQPATLQLLSALDIQPSHSASKGVLDSPGSTLSDSGPFSKCGPKSRHVSDPRFYLIELIPSSIPKA